MKVYTELDFSEPRVWMNDIQLGLGLWQGFYGECDRIWLRWYDAQGNWILTPQERERQRAFQESQRLERERRRVERLAGQFGENGVAIAKRCCEAQIATPFSPNSQNS